MDQRSKTDVTYTQQFSDSANAPEVPEGMLAFHRNNFMKYFSLGSTEFKGKVALETGAGPGKHAAALCSLGADVTAIDLLESNVKAMLRLKATQRIENLVVRQGDLMEPLPPSLGHFDLISVHNWVQHTADPARVISNMVQRLELGGRIYISVYQAGTFRFLIAQIARSFLQWEDRARMKEMVPFFFPIGFDEFENPDDIYYENIFDDFFVPYMWTFRRDRLVEFMSELGCVVLVPHEGHRRLREIDNEPLKVSFVKRTHARLRESTPDLGLDVDEFEFGETDGSNPEPMLNDVGRLAREAIKRSSAGANGGGSDSVSDSYLRAALALGLYRLRASYSRDVGIGPRHEALRSFLTRYISGDVTGIRAWATSLRLHRSEDSYWAR